MNINRIFSLLGLIGLSVGYASAQGIEPVETNLKEVIYALESNGYRFFSFDIGSLREKTYGIEIFVQEVDSTGTTDEKIRLCTWQTRRFLKEIAEKSRARFTPIDPETGLIKLVQRIAISIVPQSDSLVIAKYVFGEGNMIGVPLTLRPVGPEAEFQYEGRRFRIDGFRPNRDIPLVLFGSYWYDEEIDMIRFCTAREFEPDRSNGELKLMPHYYILGIRLIEWAE